MEKLELKHLAPYLPYGLKIRVRLIRFSCGAGGKMYTDKNVELTYKNILKFKHGVHYNSIKPILHDLIFISEHKEQIKNEWIKTHNNMLEAIFNIHWDRFIETTNIDLMPHWFYTYLVKNHFDVFGLIDKGLAISYSDAQSTSNEG